VTFFPPAAIAGDQSENVRVGRAPALRLELVQLLFFCCNSRATGGASITSALTN